MNHLKECRCDSDHMVNFLIIGVPIKLFQKVVVSSIDVRYVTSVLYDLDHGYE